MARVTATPSAYNQSPAIRNNAMIGISTVAVSSRVLNMEHLARVIWRWRREKPRRSGRRHQAETPFPSIIMDQRLAQFFLVEVRPVGGRRIIFCVGALPNQKITDA